MPRRTFLTTDIYTEGRRNQALEDRQKALEDERSASTANLTTAPEPCTPDFALDFQTLKGQIRAQFCALVSPPSVRLITTIIKDSDVVDQATYDALRIEAGNEIDESSAVAGHFEYKFGPALEALTLYRLIKLVTTDGQGGRGVTDAPLYTDTPLATFTTPAAAHAPSKPTSARVVDNFVDDTAEGVVGVTILRIYADETELLTFGEQQTDAVQPKLVKVADGSKAPSPPTNIDDPTLTFVDIVIGDLQVGREYDWTKNTAYSGGEPVTVLATSTVSIFAGGFADPSDGLANLTLVSFTGAPNESGNGLDLDIELSQPNPPYRLKNSNIERKRLPGGVFVDLNQLIALSDPIYNTAGNIHIFRTVDVKLTKTYNFRETVKSIGGFTKQFTSGDISAATSTSIPASVVAGIYTPNLIEGGQFLHTRDQFDGSGDNDSVGFAWRINAPTLAGPSPGRINKLATGVGGNSFDASGLQWLDSTHRLKINTNVFTLGGMPAYKFGRIFLPSQVYTFITKFTAETVPVTLDVSYELWDAGKAAGDESIVKKTFTITIPLTPDWAPFIWILQIPPTYTQSGGTQWGQMSFAANPSHVIHMDEAKLKNGEGYDGWTAGPIEATLDAFATITTDTGVSDVEAQSNPTLSANGDEYSIAGGILGGQVHLT